MAKKRSTKRKNTGKKNKKSSLGVFLLAIVITAALAFAITYFITINGEKDDTNIAGKESAIPKKANKEDVSGVDKNDKPVADLKIFGTWVSENDGSMLTIQGRDYTIELPNVDGTVVGKGTIVVLDSQVTFINTSKDAVCAGTPGVYNYEILDNTITFKKVDDGCKARINRLAAAWFKI